MTQPRVFFTSNLDDQPADCFALGCRHFQAAPAPSTGRVSIKLC